MTLTPALKLKLVLEGTYIVTGLGATAVLKSSNKFTGKTINTVSIGEFIKTAHNFTEIYKSRLIMNN